MDRPNSWIRGAALAASLGILLLLVAGVASTPPGGGRGIEVTREGIAATVEPIVRFLYLAILVMAFYRWLVYRDGDGRERKRRRGGPLSIIIVLAVFTSLFFFLLYTGQDEFQTWFGSETEEDEERDKTIGEDETDVEGQTLEVGVEDGVPGEPEPPSTPLAWVVLLGLGVMLLAAFVVSRRPRPPPDTPEFIRAGADPVVEAAMADPADPRGRVFRAYRRVEIAAGLRHKRQPWETVGSHLRRLPDAGGANNRLAGVYNTARFSDQSVGDGTAAAAENDAEAVAREVSE